MNSYNDNLHSDVVETLQNQLTELKTTKAALTASTFSLFYAEGAKFTAEQKLDEDTHVYQFQEQVKEQGVLNNNIAVNVNGTAQDQKAHNALSVTNTSVGAANMQIASNAILRLASNVGSIYSIVSAADFDTEIYQQSQEANRLMGITAYEAERCSQLGMESSLLTAKVSSSTVADMATSTQKSVNDMLNVVLNDFNTISATIATDNVNLSAANNAEKAAEGVVKYKNTDYFAANYAYSLNNKELNLNLQVNNVTPESFNVVFDTFRSPFAPEIHPVPGNSTLLASVQNKPAGYPVSDYYIMVVKNKNQSVFSISVAESIILDPTSPKYYRISGDTGAKREINQMLFSPMLTDTDGDAIALGTKYVVFVMVKFLEEYKKALSNFDDYLTASSNTFALKNVLAEAKSIVSTNENNNVFEFSVAKQKDEQFASEYRCILLPDKIKGKHFNAGLSSEGLRNFETEIAKRENIANAFVPKITALENKISSSQEALLASQNELRAVTAEHDKEKKNAGLNTDKGKKLEAQTKKVTEEITKTNSEISEAQKELTNLQNEQDAALKSIYKMKSQPPGFYFDLNIAEHISIANYTVATPVSTHAKNKDTHKHKHNAEEDTKEPQTLYHVALAEDTNDVFGNKLDKDTSYIPAFLTVSTAVVENRVQYQNVLSKFAGAQSYKIIPPTSVKK